MKPRNCVSAGACSFPIACVGTKSKEEDVVVCLAPFVLHQSYRTCRCVLAIGVQVAKKLTLHFVCGGADERERVFIVDHTVTLLLYC
jgi:hypothetical protein